MVVEDEDATREAMTELLGYEGFVVAAARDGLEALDLLAGNFAPDVIVLDWRMPRMDGPAFLRAIADDPALARIPVVVCSSDGRYIREAATALGACGVLTKPLDASVLLDTLAAACSRQDVLVTG
jgi:CheY-like chemotaxis protein